MYTPAFRISRFRLLFLGAAASALGALCLATSACGAKGDSPSGPSGAAGTATMAAAGMSSGGDTSGGSAATSGGAAGGGVSTAGAGGALAAAGAAGSAGASGGAVSFAGSTAVEGSPTRPQLGASTADEFTVQKYFENGSTVDAPIKDDWDPTAGVGDVTALTPKFTVAASGGSDTTIQSAIDKAVAMGGTERIAIEVADGEYREVVCVPSGGPPITLYSKNPDASATRIVFNNYAGKPKDANTPANPCNPALTATTYGTSGSPTFAAFANGFQAKNITFENDLDETGLTGSVQAVALMAHRP
jgi:pectinesterase